MKAWFNNLEKREQYILLLGAACVVFYLIYGVFYRGVVGDYDSYQKKTAANAETLVWMQSAVAQIKAARGNGGGGLNSFGNKSLSQLSELAAKRSQLRISRFQPKGDNEAQVWLDKVPFDQVLDFLVRMEVDYQLSVDSLSVNTSNNPGLVNVRLKFTR